MLLIEKLPLALTHVDSSSGAIGSWVNKALETLVPLISKAEVDAAGREIHEVVDLTLLAAQTSPSPKAI